MGFNWYVIVRWLSAILTALGVTVEAFLLSALFSLLLGLFVASLTVTRSRFISVLSQSYIAVFRNTPLLVQLFFLFYGLPFLGVRMSPLVTGVLGISLNEGAFIGEIIRGNIAAIDKGDWEAANSLGLTVIQTLRYVILPQAIRDAVPALTGQLSIIIKDTSLLSLIMVVELTAVADQIYTRLFDISGLFVAGFLYVVLFLLLSSFSKALEAKVAVRR